MKWLLILTLVLGVYLDYKTAPLRPLATGDTVKYTGEITSPLMTKDTKGKVIGVLGDKACISWMINRPNEKTGMEFLVIEMVETLKKDR